MTTSLPGYDAWKLATPPEHEADCECPLDEECRCHDRDPRDDDDRAHDAMRDEMAERDE